MNPCPICNDASAKNFKAKVCLGSQSEYDLVQCPSCASMYFRSMPEVPEIESFYDDTYWGSEAERQRGKGAAFASLYLPRTRRGEAGSAPRFLDVGCASGFFLKGVSDTSHWDCHGIEINAELAKFASENLKLKVDSECLEKASFAANSFDYIHLRDIVEHVTDPVHFLSLVRKYIKPDGKVYLSIPNGDVDVIGIMDFYKRNGRKSRSPNGHLFFLGRKSLRVLLKSAGFEIESCATYGIKTALRAKQIMPRKQKFMRQFDTKNYESGAQKVAFTPEEVAPRSTFYHILKMWVNRRLMLPWLSRFGLDYELILRPSRQQG